MILAAGGHAKVLAETVLASGIASRLAFLDDRFHQIGFRGTVLGWPVLGKCDLAFESTTKRKYPSALVAIGNSKIRICFLDQLKAFGYYLPALIHPTAWVSPSAQIGPASVVLAQAAVQSQALIGAGAILNTGCSVDHDSRLFDGVHICPGARLAGEVEVGARSLIGTGASVIPQVRIGSDVTVGAGAAVVRDLPDNVTATGVPARVVSSN